MKPTEEQTKYRRKLDCPLCGHSKTYFIKRIKKMFCQKCGHEWDRPLYK